MNKYVVYGHTTVAVSIEVAADSEEEAYAAARENLCSLTSFVGNGGTDMLVGVEEEGQNVVADEDIVYDDIELLEPDDEDDDSDEESPREH